MENQNPADKQEPRGEFTYAADFVHVAGSFVRADRKPEEIANVQAVLNSYAQQGWRLHSILRTSPTDSSGGNFLLIFEHQRKAENPSNEG